MYKLGNGVQKDERQARHFCKMAAEANDVAGQVEYGVLLGEGVGGEKVIIITRSLHGFPRGSLSISQYCSFSIWISFSID
jgi:TPR repeat protein